jgi:AcrR family transcriptional regulator
MKRDREDILKAAARYFSRGGFRTTSMQEVADALDISRSSLYYHFAEKSDLLYALVLLVTDDFVSRAREVYGYPLPADQRLRVLIRSVLKLEVENPGVPLSLILRNDGDALKPDQRAAFVARRDEYEGYFRRLIDEGIDAGTFRPVNTKVATFGLLGMLEEFDGWFSPGGPLSSDDVGDIFADLFLAALATDRAAGPFSERTAETGRRAKPRQTKPRKSTRTSAA